MNSPRNITAQANAIASRLVVRTDDYMADRLTHDELHTGNVEDWKEAGSTPSLLAETKRALRARLAPVAALVVAVLATACVEPNVHVDEDALIKGEPGPAGPPGLSRFDTYPVTWSRQTKQGEHLPEAVAPCDKGDLVIGGGCGWGEPLDPHDMPLRPVYAGPTEDQFGWRCQGQYTGVGVELKYVTATAICLVVEAQ